MVLGPLAETKGPRRAGTTPRLHLSPNRPNYYMKAKMQIPFNSSILLHHSHAGENSSFTVRMDTRLILRV